MIERLVDSIIPVDCPCGFNDCSTCMHCSGNVEDGIVYCYYDESVNDYYKEEDF